jgi:hypothetical protein
VAVKLPHFVSVFLHQRAQLDPLCLAGPELGIATDEEMRDPQPCDDP